MFILIRDNIERIVNDTCIRDKLIKDGYRVIEDKKDSELSKLTVEQLKELAIEKGLEFDTKIKKANLIELIESVEGGE